MYNIKDREALIQGMICATCKQQIIVVDADTAKCPVCGYKIDLTKKFAFKGKYDK